MSLLRFPCRWDGQQRYNDLWRLDLSTWRWQLLEPKGAPPARVFLKQAAVLLPEMLRSGYPRVAYRAIPPTNTSPDVHVTGRAAELEDKACRHDAQLLAATPLTLSFWNEERGPAAHGGQAV